MTNHGSSPAESDLPAFPCPVCGYLAFDEPPGSFAICTICCWQDDIVQLGFPRLAGGANRPSLYEAQHEFIRCGASAIRLMRHSRAPMDSDIRDPEWRPFDPGLDSYLQWDSPVDSARWRTMKSGVCLYYWRREYWLRSQNSGKAD